MKLIKMIITISIILCIFTSCQNNNNDVEEALGSQCLIMDYTNNNVYSDLTHEYTFWNYNVYNDPVAAQIKSITYDGEVYTGQYIGSRVERYYPFPVNSYQLDNFIDFEIRSTDDKMVYMDLFTNQFYFTEPLLEDLENPRSETEEIARKLAAQYIENFDEYVFEADEPDYLPEVIDGVSYDLTYYTYRFVRFIDGVRTKDGIGMKITSKGNAVKISARGIGMMEQYKDYNIPKKQCIELIEQKLDSIYNKHPAKYKGYKIDSQYLTLAEDNRLVLCTRCIVDLEYEEVMDFSTGIELVIFLDEIAN